MAKEKKLKVPKRIAGVKVPKNLRKPVNKALAAAENPAMRGLAVAALTAAAASLNERRTDPAPAPRRSGEPGTDDRAGKLTDVIVAAALDGARRLLDGLESPVDAAAPAQAPAAAPAASKRARASAAAAASAGPPAA
jgi:hypothetical protein